MPLRTLRGENRLFSRDNTEALSNSSSSPIPAFSAASAWGHWEARIVDQDLNHFRSVVRHGREGGDCFENPRRTACFFFRRLCTRPDFLRRYFIVKPSPGGCVL